MPVDWRSRRYPSHVPTLGPLSDEPPEPMKKEHFVAVQRRLRDSWTGDVRLDKTDVQRMLDEIQWLKRRLLRVEEAIQPMLEDLRHT